MTPCNVTFGEKEQNLLKVDVWVISYLSGKLVLPQSSGFMNIDL